ncbi:MULTISPECIES: hypothetical protein [unclassified Amycolatopsis]|uniref:hypothetical protein n=1 Tax=unclassified Amycolatopsis TaxID=2618356 RepID=UPI00106DE35A|nr:MULTISPECIES: hypothetical protein [unclassified Amycolatopsis]
MPKKVGHIITGTQQRPAQLVLVFTGLVLALASTAQDRWARVRASGDRGSESVEKAVLVAIGLAVVIGLAFAIRAVVQKYQGQLQ